MKIKFFERFDFVIICCVLLLSTIGVCFIYSAGINSRGDLTSRTYLKQVVWIGAGFLLMISISLLDYRKFKKYATYAYIVFIVLLVYVRLFTREHHGARSWIDIGPVALQPSEFGKILYIMFLAKFMEKTSTMNPAKRFLAALCIMGLPAGLILIQPDLGTATVYIPIFLAMCFMTNFPLRYVMFVLGLGASTIIVSLLPMWHSYIWLREAGHTALGFVTIFENNKYLMPLIAGFILLDVVSFIGYRLFKQKYYYWICYFCTMFALSMLLAIVARKVLKEYQIQRLIIFLDPEVDPRGRGWNIRQSKIAIGAGGLFGRGFKMGSQSHLQYLPEQSTDFIFSILAEEVGLIGGLSVFALFFIIMYRIMNIAKNTTSSYGYYIAVGVLGMMFFHFLVNVGMVMGVMPITGIPLPFLSYGGSSYMTNAISMGLVMSVRSRRLDFNVEIV